MKTAIVILNWNGKQDTLACLASLTPFPCAVIVVDNGSTDGSCEAISTHFPEVILIKN